jgi:hypothetical protein
MDVRTRVYREDRDYKGTFRIVDATSSDPGIPGVPPIPINLDHAALCKLATKDQRYRGVLIFIQERFGLTLGNEAEADSLDLEKTLLDVLQGRLPDRYQLIRDRTSEFSAILRLPIQEHPSFTVRMGYFFVGENSPNLTSTMRKLAIDTGWFHFGEKTTYTPMLIAVMEILPSFVEEALEFVRESIGNPTPFGALLVRLITPDRLETLSAKDVDVLLDTTQRVWVFSNK